MNLKKFKLIAIIGLFYSLPVNAANLLQVFDDALQSDPGYHQVISMQMANKEGLPISIAALLPNISLVGNPHITRSGYSGSFYRTVDGTQLAPRNSTSRSYTLNLSARQTIFDFAKFANVGAALADSRGADATINAALQDLMVRVAQRYFAILEDEDKLEYSRSSTRSFTEQFKLAKYQHEAGLKTRTDVYTAQARYDAAHAREIAAQNQLANDKENLWAMTGKYYRSLSRLSEQFPLVTPKPASMNEWVKSAQQNNWLIKQQQYAVVKSREDIKKQFAGHLPVVSLQANFNRIYDNNITALNSIEEPQGPGTQSDRQIMLNVSVPIFEGGSVIAKTSQANYQFQAAEQKLEHTIRETLNKTRQSYLNITAGISKVTADRQSIKSNISSLEGMEAGYKAGIETLVNVLNQRETLFEAQTQYATDRYAFVNSILTLKQAAGSLGFDDLKAINQWLHNGKPKSYTYKSRPASMVKARKSLAKKAAHKKQTHERLASKQKKLKNHAVKG